MADKKDKKKEEAKQDQSKQTAKIGIVTWIIMAAVVGLLAGSGFVLGNLFAGPSAQQTTEAVQNDDSAEQEVSNPVVATSDSKATWFYNDLEPVVVNPDVPGATRYVRVGLILEISSEIEEEQGKGLLAQKTPVLINWLNLFFKSLTLDQMEDDRDLKRIQSQILDAFNEILFPDAKPQIKKILIREFNVQ